MQSKPIYYIIFILIYHIMSYNYILFQNVSTVLIQKLTNKLRIHNSNVIIYSVSTSFNISISLPRGLLAMCAGLGVS